MKIFNLLGLLLFVFFCDTYRVTAQNIEIKTNLSAETRGENKESKITIQNIQVEDNTVLKTEIDGLMKSFIGQTLTLGEIGQIADKITELYLNRGYITSRAVVPKQDFADGLVKIEVKEGEIENIVIKGANRLEGYVRGRVSLGTAKPLNSGKLEDQLRLLKVNPLFTNIEATLKVGTGENKSILEVYVVEANPFFGSVGIDNYSPPSVGATEINLNLGYRNVAGLGDSISVTYSPRIEAFTGTYQLNAIYQVPLNPMDGTLLVRASIENNEIIEQPFNQLDLTQESQYYEVTFRQPLIRTPREEFALSGGFNYRNSQNYDALGAFKFLPYGDNGRVRTSVFTFGQDYIAREASGAWAVRSQFRFGTGLFDATSESADVPDGQFFSWLGQVQRVQLLGRDNLLILQADMQFTPDRLLPSEQFVIGGAQSVRGYRQNARAGDSGIRFSVEDQITLVRDGQDNSVFTVAPFFDLGYVWNNTGELSFQESQRFLAGLGLGLIWQPVSNMTVRLDYAPPLIYLQQRDNQANNIQDDGFYFSVNYRF